MNWTRTWQNGVWFDKEIVHKILDECLTFTRVFWLFTIESVLLVISPNAWTCKGRKLSPSEKLKSLQTMFTINQSKITKVYCFNHSREQFGPQKSANWKIFTSRQNTVGKVSKTFWLYFLKDVSSFLSIGDWSKGKPLTRREDHRQTFRLSTVNSYATLATNCPNFGPYTKCIITKSNNLSCHLNK